MKRFRPYVWPALTVVTLIGALATASWIPAALLAMALVFHGVNAIPRKCWNHEECEQRTVDIARIAGKRMHSCAPCTRHARAIEYLVLARNAFGGR
jgi:hypothetical protein